MSRFAIIPAYNEEKHIENFVKEVIKLGITPIVVDDGSTDRTYEICSNNGSVAIKHEINKGKGEAIKTGLKFLLDKYPEATSVVLIDADMQYHPEETFKIFNALENNNLDFVMGYRTWRKIPFRHRLGNFVWRNTFNILFNTDFKDTNCGLVGLNRNAIEKLQNNVMGGYIIDNSLLIGAIKNRLKVDQVPVEVSYHKRSQVPRGVRIVIGVFLYILKEGLRYRLRRK